MEIGSYVKVQVNSGGMGACGLQLPASPESLKADALRLIAFARGRSDHPPADTPISLYLGGRAVAEVTPSEPRSAWRVCPEGGLYAARTCPFSALEVIGRHPGGLAVTSRPPQHSCAHPRPMTGAPYSVTITPDEPLDCTAYWAVQLRVNPVGQVVGVNLVWAEP